jgi:type II secretory pathway pseudopilin PulG
LTELLVTIAVVAILAALLMPALSAGKSRAMQIQCLSNLRQLHLIGYLYVNDNGKQPSYYNANFPGGGNWMGTLSVADREKGIGICPIAQEEAKDIQYGNGQGTADIAWVRWTTDGKIKMVGSYGFNAWFYTQIGGRGWNPANTPKLFSSDADIQRPAETPVFADSNWEDSGPKETDQPYHDLYTGSPLSTWADDMGRFTISRHGGILPTRAPRKLLPGQKLPGAINVACADGHTELVPLEQLWTLYWHHNWQVPAQRPQQPH